jgi:F-type H+-transporting ATPase subunit a
MYRFLALISFFISFSAYASEGFTWASELIHYFHLPITDHVLTFLFIGILFILAGLKYRLSLTKVDNLVIPDKGFTLRNIFEVFGNFILEQCKGVIGEKEGPKYFSFFIAIFMLILVSNLIGLIPGFLPPTEHLSTTLALGIFSFIYYNYKGCREVGVFNYLKHFAGPLWYMAILIFPIEIISNLVRPVSLALRLDGNMSGDHIVLSVFSSLVPQIVPIVFLLLGILVSFIQAYVFTVLSMVYVGLAVAHQDHGEEVAH